MLRLIKYLYAPVFFLGFIGAGLIIVSQEGPLHSLLALLIVAICLSLAAEHLLPYEPVWNTAHNDGLRDVLHAFVNEASIVSLVLVLPFISQLTPWASIWPTDLPLWLDLVIAVIIVDIGITLVHYLSHRLNWLWRFHAVHHSVQRMYGFNGLLKHPVHQTLEIAGGALPWIILGIPFEVAVLASFAVSIQLLLQHSNVDMRIGPLKYIWAVAPVHRHHHIASETEGNVNFGLFLTVWDVVLGTANFSPSDSVRAGKIGLEDRPNYPVKYLDQLIEPFRSTQ